MMPSGHMRSGLELAALLRRSSFCAAALRLLGPSLEDEALPATGRVSFTQSGAGGFAEFLPESTSLVWTEFCSSSRRSGNKRRSSSSRAMSPQKAAVRKQTCLYFRKHRFHYISIYKTLHKFLEIGSCASLKASRMEPKLTAVLL